MKIAFTGAHGTGKTSTLQDLQQAEVLHSRYKFLYSGGKQTFNEEIKSNYPMMYQDHRTMERLRDLTESFMITDRCLTCIAEYCPGGYYMEVLLENIKKYDLIFYFKPSFINADWKGRPSGGTKNQLEVDKRIYDFLIKNNINFVEVKGNRLERYSQLVNYFEKFAI